MKSQKQCYRERVTTLNKIIRDFDRLIKHLYEYEDRALYAFGFVDGYVEKLCSIKKFFDDDRDELLRELTRYEKRA